MSSDLVLARGTLKPGWIDLALGEPTSVRENLKLVLHKYKLSPELLSSDINSHMYQSLEGTEGLVRFLQYKHDTEHIVVTCGAKQALYAAMFALKKSGVEKVYTPKPYWLPFPGMIKDSGLKMTNSMKSYDASLVSMPNNPDGSRLPKSMDKLSEKLVVFDGAYYSEQYLTTGETTKRIGDIQIFSYSKMYGLSGLRVGYVICSNKKLADYVKEYIETTTMGVSTASQLFILNIEEFFFANPSIKQYFMTMCRRDLATNRTKLKELSKKVLNTKDIPNIGMYALLKKGPKFTETIENAKIKVFDGEYFGKKGYARVSMSLDPKVFARAIDKLNIVAK